MSDSNTATALSSIKQVLFQPVNRLLATSSEPRIIAVSKGQGAERIEAALAAGHREFGENRVQEAALKWGEIKKRYPDVRLHLIGPLQSNKAADAVALFDVIHTIDRPKIAQAITAECQRQHKSIECLIEVNIGDEPQKAGIATADMPALLAHCRELGLAISGLMAIPPHGKPPAPYFALLHKLARQHGLSQLSMGMSSDYEIAAQLGATYVRIGTAIFGARGH